MLGREVLPKVEGGRDTPYIPTLVPWWPYYTGIYSPVCLPGSTSRIPAGLVSGAALPVAPCRPVWLSLGEPMGKSLCAS